MEASIINSRAKKDGNDSACHGGPGRTRSPVAAAAHALFRAGALGLLAVPRLAVLTAAEILAAAACAVAAAGADDARPLARWRRVLVAGVVPACTRVMLACVGFWRIRVVGVVDPTARLFVSNHCHLLDGFVLNWLLRSPSFVARASLQALPLFGTVLRAQQCTLVDVDDSASRQTAAAAIVSRCASQVCSVDVVRVPALCLCAWTRARARAHTQYICAHTCKFRNTRRSSCFQKVTSTMGTR